MEFRRGIELWVGAGPCDLSQIRGGFGAEASGCSTMSPNPLVDGDRDGVSRRDFLRVGSMSVVALTAAEQARRRAMAQQKVGARRCLLVVANGGPCQLDTFDPKPHATLDVRGPFRPIQTAVSGTFISELLPNLARRAEKYLLVRSMHHTAAPIHEASQQLLETGRLRSKGLTPPSLGSLVARHIDPEGAAPLYAVLPEPVKWPMSMALAPHGAGSLGEAFEPWTPASAAVDEKELVAQWLAKEDATFWRLYGRPGPSGDLEFGRQCLLARVLLEHDFRFVTVQMFPHLEGQLSWDCHASETSSPTTVSETARVAPAFDRAISGLLDDLDERGLLQETLVVVAGEFGRTPRINRHGGRDHWANAWSILMAGGGLPGGTILGATTENGGEPADCPVTPTDLATTILTHFGCGSDSTELAAGVAIGDRL